MTVGLVGSGPAAAAVTAALADVDVSVSQTDPTDLETTELGIVVAVTGEQVFQRVNTQLQRTPWIAVELGGVGGYPIVDAAVTGFGPETACYSCLAGRIEANVDPDEQPSAAPAAPQQRFAGAIAGRAAATALTSDDGDIFGQVRTIPEATHPLLALPHCDCGSAPERTVERTSGDRDVEAALASAELALDERTGLVSEVGEVESYPVPYYLARACDTSGFSDATASQEAAGVAGDWNAALMKALGEALERYCAGVYRVGNLTEAEPDALDDPVLPSTFVTPDLLDDDQSRYWIEGRQLHDDRSVSLPAELVQYPPPEREIRPAITTGLGLGNGTIEALLSGLYEVIERDASMLAWYSSFEPLGLDVTDEQFQTIAARTRAEGLSVTPLLLTQDVDVPVVAVAVHREGEWPRFALGSAADLDPDAAARSALAEAVQNWVELRGMGRDAAADASGAIGWYADFPEEIETFVNVDQDVSAAVVGPEAVPTGEDELDSVLAQLGESDLTAYASRITTRDVASLGFEAVRVLCPKAQPLFFDDAYFGERARTVPESLGFEPRLDREHHPFP
jgi:ribosomal protein S12 methylthiotransferase accessory factor